VRFFRYLALLIFFLDLPVPLYWFILHPFANFWRTRVRAAFYIAGLGAWTAGGIFIFCFRNSLVAPGVPSVPLALLGVAPIVANAILLRRVGKDLGHMRLVGHAELTGKTDLVTVGIYRHIRHPRYAGMIISVAGACILTGTRFALAVSAIWLILVFAVILLEEREMRARFGDAYRNYCEAVPRFLPRI
jgi:protein-S-isoprenylcysteine O-methyltransferase Ste14